MRFVTNYTKGWSGPDLEYEDFRGKVTKEGHRLAETLLPLTSGRPEAEVQSTRTALYSTPLQGEPLTAGGTVTDIQAINTL